LDSSIDCIQTTVEGAKKFYMKMDQFIIMFFGLCSLIFALLVIKIIQNRHIKPFSFEKRNTFFVTGSASGIGKELTFNLLKRGQNVVATDINLDGLQVCATEWEQKLGKSFSADRLFVAKLDVTDFQQWKELYASAIKRFQRVDVHMNIAGFLAVGYFHDFENLNSVMKHIDINLKGVIFGTQVALNHMKEKKSGHIVNMGSLAALCPVTGLSVYAASKSAVRSFTLSVNEEVRREFGVSLTVICPDAVNTPMLDMQVDRKEAVLTFSGTILTTQKVVDVILDDVLTEKPCEVWIPKHRGILATIGNLAYGTTLAHLLSSSVIKKGLKMQQSMKKKSS